MNDEIAEMLKTPGLYVVGSLLHPGWAYVVVDEKLVCHQLKPLDIVGKQMLFKRDGVLSKDGWRDDAIVSGPITTREYQIQ